MWIKWIKTESGALVNCDNIGVIARGVEGDSVLPYTNGKPREIKVMSSSVVCKNERLQEVGALMQEIFYLPEGERMFCVQLFLETLRKGGDSKCSN